MLESLGSDLTEHLQLFTVWKARDSFEGLELRGQHVRPEWPKV